MTEETLKNSEQPMGLKKQIGLFESISMVIGVVIGAGIFFKAAPVFGSAGTPLLGILAWLIGGLVTMASALTIAEIAVAIPKTGGVFVYLKELYSERVAFLFGWVQTMIYVPGTLAALAIIFATQATYFIPMSGFAQKLLAIFILLFIASINVISTKLGSSLQAVTTVAKLLPIFVIVAFGFINGEVHQSVFSTIEPTSSIGLAGFGSAMLGVLWAYDGWVSVGNIGGELRNPKRDLPRSIIFGLLSVVIIYILINIAILKIMPLADIVASSKPASDAAVILFGNTGAALISGGILISIFGALNGYLMMAVRIPFAMAQDRLFIMPNFFGKVNERFKTPVNVFLLEVVLAIIYIISGSFETLTSLAVFVIWIFFVLAVAGIFKLRKRIHSVEGTYKVPLYPFVPLIGIFGGIFIIASMLITDTFNALIGIVITAIGLPVYYFIKKGRKPILETFQDL